MQVTTKELKSTLSVLNSIVEKKSSMKVLEFIKLTSSEGVLAITATNLEETLLRTIACTGSDVDMLIPFQRLNKLLKTSPKNADAIIEHNKSAGKASIAINGMNVSMDSVPVDEWPDTMKTKEKNGRKRRQLTPKLWHML